ncbi:MAG: NAD-dependent epimerase/dehydratase family protein, partial [Hyphomonadaceae bacterium]
MAARILVTGSSGFVGGALGRWLREHEGAHVTGLSRTPPREGACDERVAHDLALGAPFLPAYDAIVHCAALAAPWAKPAAYERANIDGLRHMLANARRV